MIDSHCHIDVDAYANDRDAALMRARDAGVTEIIVPAVDEPSWAAIRALADRSDARMPRCRATVGIHPVALPNIPEDQDASILDRLAKAIQPGIVAIGECGLDATIDLRRASMQRQERVLTAHIRIAREANLPLILHARGPIAYEAITRLLTALPTGWRGVIHSYGGGVDLLKRLLPLPLYFGFAGPATYANARRIRATIAAIPEDRLLAETDAPDQTPEPHRPGRSEPAYLPDIIRGIAAIRNTSEDAMRRITLENAQRLFGS
jgi:TatD DNase family protein